jgi:Domain of unknown function (DUF4333)
MPKERLTRLMVVGSIGAALLCTSSSAAGAATGSVPKAVVESQSAKILAAETGQGLPHVQCPGDLRGKVGASIRCVLTPKGSKLKYPVVVTVNSVRKGTAHFHVQVGQAFGAANKVKFCADTATIDKATSVVHTTAELIPIFEANLKTIMDFQSVAPSAVVASAGTLVQAVRTAVNSGNANAFATPGIMKAEAAVNAFCGFNADGSPTGT